MNGYETVKRPARPGERLRHILLVGFMTLPIATAYTIMARFSVNMPYIDDYPTILGFSLKYESLHGVGARLNYILADQYVEYKLVFVHLFSAVLLALTHHVNFAIFFWVGNLTLLPLLAVLWKSYFIDETDLSRRLLLFLPIVFLLFSVNYGEALDWTATSLGYIGTLTLSLASIQLLVQHSSQKENWCRTGACLCALMASLIAANAFLLLPIGLLLLLPRRAYLWACAWCGVFALALAPYFVFFTRNTRFGNGSPLLIPIFFLSFLGSAFQFVPLAAPVGLLILILSVSAVRTGYWRTHQAATLSMGWLIVSAALAAGGRGRTGLAFSVVSRYRIYSDLFLIFCYGYLAHRVTATAFRPVAKKGLYLFAVSASVLLCLHGEYQAVNILSDRRERLLAGAAYYRARPKEHSPMHFGDPATDAVFALQERDARDWIAAAEERGLYHLPSASPR